MYMKVCYEWDTMLSRFSTSAAWISETGSLTRNGVYCRLLALRVSGSGVAYTLKYSPHVTYVADTLIFQLLQARVRIFSVCRDRSSTPQTDGRIEAQKNSNGSTGDRGRRGSRSPLLYGAHFSSVNISYITYFQSLLTDQVVLIKA